MTHEPGEGGDEICGVASTGSGVPREWRADMSRDNANALPYLPKGTPLINTGQGTDGSA